MSFKFDRGMSLCIRPIRVVSVLLITCVVLTMCGCSGTGESTVSVVSGESSQNDPNAVQTAKAVVNRFDKSDVFVAAVDVTQSPFCADPTGQEDATAILNKAMSLCAGKYSCGTVYMPAGTYKISGQLVMRQGVTLRGEYNPNALEDGDYGTVISVNTLSTAVSVVQGSAVSGISFFYPEQSLNTPYEADYTITCQTGNAVLTNVTLINSWKGISFGQRSGGAYGNCVFNSVRGTALKQGVDMESEGGYYTGSYLYLTPEYWSKAGEKYNAPSDVELRSWMSTNSDTGLIMSGCEFVELHNGLIDGYPTGISTPTTARTDKAETYATVYDFTVKNAMVALDTPALYTDMGLLAAKCSFSGSSYDVKNSSKYPVKLFNCTLSGKTIGDVVSSQAKLDLPTLESKNAVPAKLDLFQVSDYGADDSGKTDCSAEIQKALDAARDNGGGIVYIPGGAYRLESPITVYAGTMLCGTFGNNIPSFYNGERGSNLLCYYGKGMSGDDTALVTLAGNGASMTGIMIYYPSNGLVYSDGKIKNVDEYGYTIRATAANTSCRYVGFMGSYRAIEMKKADNFIIEYCQGGVYKNIISIKSCKGGYANNVDAGPTAVLRCTSFQFWPDFSEWSSTDDIDDNQDYMRVVFENFSTKVLENVNVSDSTGIILVDTGMYRARTLLVAKNSEVMAINHLASRSGKSYYAFELSGGNTVAINNHLKTILVVKAEKGAKYGLYNIKGQDLVAGTSENNYVN